MRRNHEEILCKLETPGSPESQLSEEARVLVPAPVKHGPREAVSASPGNLLETQTLVLRCGATELGSLGVGSRSLFQQSLMVIFEQAKVSGAQSWRS